jgi:hypothetical protein
VGPRASLDAVAKRKILCPRRQSNPGRPARSLVIIPTVLPRLFCCTYTVPNSIAAKEPEDGRQQGPRNVGTLPRQYTASQASRPRPV